MERPGGAIRRGRELVPGSGIKKTPPRLCIGGEKENPNKRIKVIKPSACPIHGERPVPKRESPLREMECLWRDGAR